MLALAKFSCCGEDRWGTENIDGIVALNVTDDDVRRALGTDNLPALFGIGSDEAYVDPASITNRLPPLASQRPVFCVGLNYASHVNDAGRKASDYPSIFLRAPSSFVGAGVPVIRPRESTHFDFEGELAIVIGRGGRRINARDALGHVAGYTCLGDHSVRDFQKHGAQVTPGKNFDASGAIGPALVLADEIDDPSALTVTTRLNGAVVQQGSLRDLIFPIPELIAYISSFATLHPGDVIATGTPQGVGSSRTPPLWMQAGDVIEVEIPGIGILSNPVRDDASLSSSTEVK